MLALCWLCQIQVHGFLWMDKKSQTHYLSLYASAVVHCYVSWYHVSERSGLCCRFVTEARVLTNPAYDRKRLDFLAEGGRVPSQGVELLVCGSASEVEEHYLRCVEVYQPIHSRQGLPAEIYVRLLFHVSSRPHCLLKLQYKRRRKDIAFQDRQVNYTSATRRWHIFDSFGTQDMHSSDKDQSGLQTILFICRCWTLTTQKSRGMDMGGGLQCPTLMCILSTYRWLPRAIDLMPPGKMAARSKAPQFGLGSMAC